MTILAICVILSAVVAVAWYDLRKRIDHVASLMEDDHIEIRGFTWSSDDVDEEDDDEYEV